MKQQYRIGVAIEGGVTLVVEADSEAEARDTVEKACDWGADVVIDNHKTDTVHREWHITDIETL